jgi:hypothetical protein
MHNHFDLGGLREQVEGNLNPVEALRTIIR